MILDFVMASTLLDSNEQENRLIVSTSDFRLMVFSVKSEVHLIMETLLESRPQSTGLCLTIAVSPTMDLLALGFVGDLQLYRLLEHPVKAFSLLHHHRTPHCHEPIAGIFFLELPQNRKSLMFYAYERQHAHLSLEDFKLLRSPGEGLAESKTQAMCKGTSTLFILEDGYLNKYTV